MRLDVYNTYARRSDGGKIHFDVLMPTGSLLEQARECALQWLESIGVRAEQVVLDSCEFCHIEEATPEFSDQVTSLGYAILQMEGCPSSII